MPKPLSVRIRQKGRRLYKVTCRACYNLGHRRAAPARAVFVFGSHRSGTRLPMDVFSRSLAVMTYKEGHSHAFNRNLLKDKAEIAALLRRSLFPVVAFKPSCESYRAAELLDSFPDSRAVWIFRHFKDAVNSAARKWGHGRKNLRAIAAGDLAAAGWRAGGLTPDKIALVQRLYSEEMSSHAAHALMWYLQNHLFLDQQLFQRREVLLVKYEDLVSRPQEHFRRVFDFIGIPFKDKYVDEVYDSSIRKEAFPPIPSEIETLCQDLHQRLVAHYERAVGSAPSRPAMLTL
ncbi:MAG: sulfotransferase [candidate division KSB1 bacterium]|nr:sulfotransferase [candidate division KSB1 bacterium]MDZ7272775.1 sulfotransferase [candidate division KSB1 bacterium]MDZ7284201.1 sulfotransferase [candidate division KSB1 bacterium]MDZ7297401.1 sulfotransferase [candidate division KSB1 bacterium]MDZ7306539.1 sulfotransferase [candidate division KSB1 bacterium]